MNLSSSPWIPCRTTDGTRLFSLREIFSSASKILDLDCAPQERVSLMRLLVCITQAALGFPEDPEEWKEFSQRLHAATPILDYLETWHAEFELFGDGRRFLQVQTRGDGEAVPSSKLIPHLATGNNALLFDHEGDRIRSLPPHRLALALLAFQNFYPVYGRNRKGRGPCCDANMLHTLVLGGNLAETILRNCLDLPTLEETKFRARPGRPLWELDETADDFEETATMSYLGRLVPRHRNLRLLEDGTGFHLDRGGLQYSAFPAVAEPSATVTFYRKGKEEFDRLLSARLDRATWRELHALTVNRHARPGGSQRGAPAVLECQSVLAADNHDIPIWTGALITDLKAKIIDTVESTFELPSHLFTPEGRELFHRGVLFADLRAKALSDAVTAYGKALMVDRPDTGQALRHYWNTLDQESVRLLDLVRRLDPIPDDYRFSGESDHWGAAVNLAARNAYRHACPRQSVRQKIAHAKGLAKLFGPAPRKTARS